MGQLEVECLASPVGSLEQSGLGRFAMVPATTTTRKLLCRTAQAPVSQLGTRLCKPNLMLGEALYADYALMIVVTSVRMQW
jgi:hypothetical protein